MPLAMERQSMRRVAAVRFVLLVTAERSIVPATVRQSIILATVKQSTRRRVIRRLQEGPRKNTE